MTFDPMPRARKVRVLATLGPASDTTDGDSNIMLKNTNLTQLATLSIPYVVEIAGRRLHWFHPEPNFECDR